MTLFDYLVIGFGLLFTGTAMRLIGGLGPALHPERRYWVHALLTFLTLLAVAVSFWNFWGLKEVNWSLPIFLLVLLIPGLWYYCSCVLIPENPNEINDWQAYYYSVRVRFYLGLAGLTLVIIITSFLVLELPLGHPARIGQVVILAISVMGALSANPRVHMGLVIAMCVIVIVASITIASQPAWLIE